MSVYLEEVQEGDQFCYTTPLGVCLANQHPSKWKSQEASYQIQCGVCDREPRELIRPW